MNSFDGASSAYPANPSVLLPLELLRRLTSEPIRGREIQIVLIIAALTRRGSEEDVAISTDTLMRHEMVSAAGSIGGTPIQEDDWFWEPLEQAVTHGFILKFSTITDEGRDMWYLLNSLENASLVARLAEGLLPMPDRFWISPVTPRVQIDRPTVFRLYEQNVGPLTPLIAERLIKAVELYPVEWIEAAIAESVTYNRRNWRYISRILENWATNGLPSSTGSR